MVRGNFEPESSHFRPVGWLRPLGRRLTLCPGGRGQIARMGTFGVKVPKEIFVGIDVAKAQMDVAVRPERKGSQS